MKKINDEFGHREGDQALLDTATILKETFRTSDIIARLGGDEFVILLDDYLESHGHLFSLVGLLLRDGVCLYA